ncbi:MAG: CDP-alcohol phosphatidyltransferase family protein [Coriobacteriia bacterium]|nr:CDP-alcohol phosphatidyltransferase family protein [Coriobacteriia bacterium]
MNHSADNDKESISQEQSVSKIDSSRKKSERILTTANAITLARMLLVPVVFFLIIDGRFSLLAFAIFALAGLTDMLDGYVARRTNSVTEFGKAIDPFVDRLLLACGVIALFIVGKLPTWILGFIVFRDFFLLSGVAIMRRITTFEIKIRYVGKMATTALLVGFAGLISGIGQMDVGLGWTDSALLPGFSHEHYLVWIWFVYIGLILSFITLLVYIWDGVQLLIKAQGEEVK